MCFICQLSAFQIVIGNNLGCSLDGAIERRETEYSTSIKMGKDYQASLINKYALVIEVKPESIFDDDAQELSTKVIFDSPFEANLTLRSAGYLSAIV